jgi:light-harvesting complex 1 beta chain
MAEPAVDRVGHGAPVGATSFSGLTEPEAREFHKAFTTGFLVFTVIAIVAHILVWQWRPWIPGVAGYEVSPPAAVGSLR